MHGWVVEDAMVLITVLDSRISRLEAEIRKQASPTSASRH
jgi:uncharacterized small protein (DUF1192 family)